MGKTDLQLRNKAIPFQAQIHGLNSTPLSSQKISLAQPGDLLHLVWKGNGNSQQYYPVRFLKPFAGNISQAYFTMDFQTNTTAVVGNGSEQIRLYIGAAPFNSDHRTLKAYDYSVQQSIRRDHERLTKSSAPLTVPNGTRLQINALDILPIIATDPDSEFYSDQFFSLGLYFVDPPSKGGIFDLLKFKVDAAVNLGGL